MSWYIRSGKLQKLAELERRSMNWKGFIQGALNKFLDYLFRTKSLSNLLVKMGASGLFALLTPWVIIEGLLSKNKIIDPLPFWPPVVVCVVSVLLILAGVAIYVWERCVGLTQTDTNVENARGVLVTYLARSYSSLFNACNWTISVEHHKDLSGDARYEHKAIFIRKAVNDLKKLKNKVTTDQSVLNADLSAKLALFQENAEDVIKKLAFFIRTYTLSGMQQQLVGYSPIPNLVVIEEIVESLKRQYSQAFMGEGVVFSGILAVEELEAVWEKSARERGLCLDANNFKKLDGRQIVVYDTTVLSKLYGIQDREIITLWNADELRL